MGAGSRRAVNTVFFNLFPSLAGIGTTATSLLTHLHQSDWDWIRFDQFIKASEWL